MICFSSSPPSSFFNFVDSAVRGFPGSSAGKESTCNAVDPSLIPGLGRSPGEGKGYPLQYSGLENPYMGSWLSDFHFHSAINF